MSESLSILAQAYKIVYDEEVRCNAEEKAWRDFAKSMFGDIDYLLNFKSN